MRSGWLRAIAAALAVAFVAAFWLANGDARRWLALGFAVVAAIVITVLGGGQLRRRGAREAALVVFGLVTVAMPTLLALVLIGVLAPLVWSLAWFGIGIGAFAPDWFIRMTGGLSPAAGVRQLYDQVGEQLRSTAGQARDEGVRRSLAAFDHWDTEETHPFIGAYRDYIEDVLAGVPLDAPEMDAKHQRYIALARELQRRHFE